MSLPSPVQTFHRDTYPAINPSNSYLSTKGRNVVITGGGSGLGPAIVRSFATSGASSITLLGRTEKTLLETKISLSKDFPNTEIYIAATDIANKDSISAAFEIIKSNIGKIDILIANAGIISQWCLLAESTMEEWYKGFDVNVKGNFNLIKEFLPIAAPKAVVINVSAGMAHLKYYPKSLSYHASKLAAINIFDYLHYENPDLFVIHIHPGILKTGLGGGIPGRTTPDIPYDTCEYQHHDQKDTRG